MGSGYSVLTYDATGTGASGGSGTRGLAQSALDLDAALTRAEQEDLPILLFGHSWGGYGLDRISAQPQATWKEPVLRINN